MMVDAHVHIWLSEAAPAMPVATIVDPRVDVPLEMLERYMDDHGVDRAVLVQPAFREEDNSAVADPALQFPHRFAAVCVVDPRYSGASQRLRYWVRERGCRGLRLRPRLASESEIFGDRRSFPLWEAANELGVVVSILADPRHLATVSSLADRFPNVDIIIDHLAHPPVGGSVEPLLELARRPRVFVKMSGYHYFSGQEYPYTDCRGIVDQVIERFGAGRLIWGSDFPHVLFRSGYLGCLRHAEQLFAKLSPEDRRAILGDNAKRLYWRD